MMSSQYSRTTWVLSIFNSRVFCSAIDCSIFLNTYDKKLGMICQGVFQATLRFKLHGHLPILSQNTLHSKALESVWLVRSHLPPIATQSLEGGGWGRGGFDFEESVLCPALSRRRMGLDRT